MVARGEVRHVHPLGTLCDPGGVWKDKVHAGAYSEWLIYCEKIPAKEYAQLANHFNPMKFDANAWTAIAQKTGMKYRVLTTKHHDGFSLFSDAQVENISQSNRKLLPECVINRRIKGCRFTERIPPPHCDYISTGDNEIADKNLGFEWENLGSMNTSYGYNANDHNWMSAMDIVCRLVDIVSKGGNHLLNVRPTAELLSPQPCIDRLAEVGEWMNVNQEAIYGTMPWRVSHDGPLPAAGTGMTLAVPPQKPDQYVFVYRIEFDKLPVKTTA